MDTLACSACGHDKLEPTISGLGFVCLSCNCWTAAGVMAESPEDRQYQEAQAKADRARAALMLRATFRLVG